MEKGKNSNKTKEQKNNYNTPKLNIYGSISDLTSGGSGPMTEMKAMMNVMKMP